MLDKFWKFAAPFVGGTLQQMLVVALIGFFVGVVPGCYVGGCQNDRAGFRDGYSAGYADAKAGKRPKRWPNIWRADETRPTDQEPPAATTPQTMATPDEVDA